MRQMIALWAAASALLAAIPRTALAETTRGFDAQGSAFPQQGLSEKERREVRRRLGSEAARQEALKRRADEVTKRIGDLASSGKLTSSDEAVKLLQRLVDELSEIREALRASQRQIAEALAFVEEANKTLPKLQNDVASLQTQKVSNYVQFQYADTQEGPNSPGGNNRTNSDGFAMRRVRLGVTDHIAPNTSMKLSFDVATGSNRTSAELKDALLRYDLAPNTEGYGRSILLGQQPMPLGYELPRSSSEREFPERALYNRTLFAGERNRGVAYEQGLGDGWKLQAGLWNALTVSDPQAEGNFRNVVGTTLAVSAGVRKDSHKLSVGASLFAGERPSKAGSTITTWRDLDGDGVPDPGEVTTVVVPPVSAADRRFFYLDAMVKDAFFQGLTLRGELMIGRDRVPTLGSTGVPISLSESNPSGWHLLATYDLNTRNQIHYKIEFFDPDVSASDDTTTHGLAFTHWLGKGAKIVLAHEWVREQGFDRKNDLTTLRIQYKF